MHIQWDIFVDKSRDVYIADKENNRIRKIDGNTGIITTVAGDGKSKAVAITHSGPHRGQFYGDGGPATKAGITSPMSVYVDDNNNIYIADTLNHRIRKIDSTGVITTLAGDGRLGIITSTYRDVGNWATQIWGYTGAFFGEGKLATQASLSFPSDVWVDSRGDVYVADRDNHRIRRIDSKTGIITTIVGDGWRHSEYEGLPGKYVGHGEKEGTYSSRIRDGRFNGDGQLAHKASLNQPFGIHIDLQGNLYIADTHNDYIRKVESIAVSVTLAEDRSADFDSDGLVGFPDFLFFVTQFGKTQTDTDFDARSDLNSDGSVDFADFIAFANQFGKTS